MIQYQDNSFSEIMEAEKAFDKFKKEFYQDVPIKALHIGTKTELTEMKEEVSLREEIKVLKERVDDLEIVDSDFLIMPTIKDLDKYGEDK